MWIAIIASGIRSQIQPAVEGATMFEEKMLKSLVYI
jgi:hypothetical protein